jgi:chemotaxis signal transduction protein
VASFLAQSSFAGGKYLTFRVARLDFAINSSCVRGIMPARDMTPVETPPPGTPDQFLRNQRWTIGFASLQGRDFPVVDLRAKLSLPHGSLGRQPCIVVVEVGGMHGPQTMGFIADRVTEIVQVRERDFTRGKLRNGGRPRQVLDPACLL